MDMLFWYISFLLIFLIHDGEEIFVQHRWVQTHRNRLEIKLKRLKPLVQHLAEMTTRGFAVAVLEEFVLLLAATVYAFVGGPFALQIWMALFIAFCLHFLMHIGQSVFLQSYVPGLVTSVLFIPYAYFGIRYIYDEIGLRLLVVLALCGVLILAINLPLAHLLGRKLS